MTSTTRATGCLALALALAGVVLIPGAALAKTYVATETLDGRRAPANQPRTAIDFVLEGRRVHVRCQIAGAPTPYGGNVWDLVRPVDQVRLPARHRNRYLYVPDNFIDTDYIGFSPAIPRCKRPSVGPPSNPGTAPRPAPSKPAPAPARPKPKPAPATDWHGCPAARFCVYRHSGFRDKFYEIDPSRETTSDLPTHVRRRVSSAINRTRYTVSCWEANLGDDDRLFTMNPGALRSSLGAANDRCEYVARRG